MEQLFIIIDKPSVITIPESFLPIVIVSIVSISVAIVISARSKIYSKYINPYRRQSHRDDDYVAPIQAFSSSTVGNRKKLDHDREMQSKSQVLERKNCFIRTKHGKYYGYESSAKGHIDTWRKREFPSLIQPIGYSDDSAIDTRSNSSNSASHPHQQNHEVYLDYAGSGIPSLSLLDALHTQSLKDQILANPHSNGPAAARTKAAIQNIKKQVLDFFNANAGCRYGYQEREKHPSDGSSEQDYHPGYDVIFTSGTTHALQIVAENFNWKGSYPSHSNTKGGNSTLVYSQNSHTSVIGMREPAMGKGASFQCRSLKEISSATPDLFDKWTKEVSSPVACSQSDDEYSFIEKFDENEKPSDLGRHDPNNLIIFPLECNFGGTKCDAQSIIKSAHEAQSNWFSMIDIAKAATSDKINLRSLDPDFACISFYKVFGAPTGIGALFVKRSSRYVLTHIGRGRKYFGGGAVDIVLPKQDFVQYRSTDSSLDALVGGTVNFRSVLSLRSCLDEIRYLGMEAISMHTRSLAIEAALRLAALKHYNGSPVVDLYGQWGPVLQDAKNGVDTLNESKVTLPGPIVAFNVLRSDGSYVGYNEVSKLAALGSVPIQFRTGCFCNPGACQDVLNLSEDQAKRYYLKNKKVCGDSIDIIDGFPTGAIRISMGKDSLWEDVDILVSFIQRTFSDNCEPIHSKTADPFNNATTTNRLEEIFVFPIKSCAAMTVKRWKMDANTGKLLFDRQFALVDSSGRALRLCQHPKMGMIRPCIDLETMAMDVMAPGCPKLTIGIGSECQISSMKEIKVCGNKCDGNLWGSHYISSWFTEYLGVQCWLARSQGVTYSTSKMSSASPGSKRSGFENEAPLLLISKNSVERLNEILEHQSLQQVNPRYFRPNLVVGNDPDCSCTNPEDQWKSIFIPKRDIELLVTGHCARCSMVDIDPDSGMKGFTLRALAEYRRKKGQITFGIFLKILPRELNQSRQKVISIEIGDDIIIKY